MDPNPGHFPILSYVMSRVSSVAPRPPTASDSPNFVDVEQPPFPPSSDPSSSSLPQITDPELLASMTRTIYDVVQTRSMLRLLGDRPDHEAVDNAKAKVADLEAHLSRQLEEIVLSPRPHDTDVNQWRNHQAEKEKELRKLAEDEKRVYKAVIQLDQMHDAYEKLLKDAEKRLVKIYNSAGGYGAGDDEEGKPEKEEINEEVVGILQNAYGQGMERVDISSRGLKVLPEAFGRISGLVVLIVSNNHLTVSPLQMHLIVC